VTTTPDPAPEATASPLEEKLERALTRLEQARPFAKTSFQGPVLELARRLMSQPDGIERLYALAPRFDRSGIFAGTDWDDPASLLPDLVGTTIQHGQPATVVLECLSELRLLAVARGDAARPGLPAERARSFLTQVLALNLDRLFGASSETDRERLGALGEPVRRMFQYLLAHIGFEDILESLITEIWRILAQRPIQVGHVKAMIRQIEATLSRGAGDLGETRLSADRLIRALSGPTEGSRDEPTAAVYRERLGAMDLSNLQQEAHGFARAMHDVGLVCEHHATFLRWVLEHEHGELIAAALGLSSTGVDVLRCYPDLVHRLILEAIHPETAQAVYGLALLLERSILYDPPVAPGLWRQLALRPSPKTREHLASVYGDAHLPRVFLLAGVISLLGQPLGIGQGNNPTCQSARALSMWSFSAPDYLLHLISQATRFDGILMHFEGQPLASASLPAGLLRSVPLDADPVSILLVPHLDRIYAAMGELCADRGEDPHRWINPEFHGWWVGREFVIAVDVATGLLHEYESFVRHFYASYHPLYNGNQPIIHPQPAGLAITDSSGEFIGWHAITRRRAALDQDGAMRVYFYNPNNDGGQDWGHGVVVSTQGHGERFGESSLPFPELASRLYIFHDDPVEESINPLVPAEELQAVIEMAQASWAKDRVPPVAAASATNETESS
jgi:hypothetical protein